MNSFNKFIVAFSSVAVAGVGTFFILENLKTGPDFCVSCHLENGERLHSPQHKAFNAPTPANLAAKHRVKSVEKFGCLSCHSGKSPGMKIRVHMEEVKNTAQYFFFKFEEPKKIDPSLMPDENCEPCHHDYKGGESSFHGMKAHIPKVSSACVSCHKAHSEGAADNYFMVEKEVVGVCRKCHPRIPPSFKLNGKYRP